MTETIDGVRIRITMWWRFRHWLIRRIAGRHSVVMNCRIGEDGWALTVTQNGALIWDVDITRSRITEPIRFIDERGIISGWVGTSNLEREAAG